MSLDVSPTIPTHKTTIGIHASGGIGRITENTGHMIRLNVGKIPNATPNETPTMQASTNETRMRRTLAHTCIHSGTPMIGFSTNRINLPAVSIGPARFVFHTEAAHHRPNTQITDITDNILYLYFLLIFPPVISNVSPTVSPWFPTALIIRSVPLR